MTNAFILADGRESLRRNIKSSEALSPADRAFIAWLLAGEFLEICDETSIRLSVESLKSYHYHDLAVLGYHWEVGGALDKEIESKWVSGANRLFGRSPSVDGMLMPFSTDSVALFGIALGLRRLGNEVLREKFVSWLHGILGEVRKLTGLPVWSALLFEVIEGLEEDNVFQKLVSNLELAYIATGLQSKLLFRDALITAEVSSSVLRNIRDQNLRPIDEPIPSALLMAAGNFVIANSQIISLNHLSIDQVVNLLGQFESAFKRWCWEEKPRTRRSGQARQWHVDNEYHVQDLLYFLLRPIFHDLKDEENLPSVGHKHPRADLYIPSLSLIIEVKFKYKNVSFSKLIEEIGADSALYLAGESKYKKILVFVWDDSRMVEQHSLFIAGLTRIAGVISGVVVSRPGIMNYPEDTDES